MIRNIFINNENQNIKLNIYVFQRRIFISLSQKQSFSKDLRVLSRREYVCSPRRDLNNDEGRKIRPFVIIMIARAALRVRMQIYGDSWAGGTRGYKFQARFMYAAECAGR